MSATAWSLELSSEWWLNDSADVAISVGSLRQAQVLPIIGPVFRLTLAVPITVVVVAVPTWGVAQTTVRSAVAAIPKAGHPLAL